jgi:hypothetical protein
MCWSTFEAHAQVLAAESRLDGRLLYFFEAAPGGPCASKPHDGKRNAQEQPGKTPGDLSLVR